MCGAGPRRMRTLARTLEDSHETYIKVRAGQSVFFFEQARQTSTQTSYWSKNTGKDRVSLTPVAPVFHGFTAFRPERQNVQ